MSPASNASGAPLPSVAILGVDALLAARPATPVQLAHACQAAGYAAVYPVTWGDELLAAACMRRVAARGDDAAIFCACPHVSDALLEVGSDLARFLIPLVAPPVACARYLRALYGYNRVRITYIGACPGAHDPAIDARLTPVQFLGVLGQLAIDLHAQPEVFESVLPPDRRRHRSVPGGAPTSDMLATEGNAHTLEEIITDDWKTELAQRLLFKARALFDIAPSLGCHCAGARPGVAPEAARPSVIALEPPRASSDVIDSKVAVDVDRALPIISTRPPEIREAAPQPIVAAPPPDERPPEPAPPPPPLVPPPSFEPAPAEMVAAEEEARRRKAAAPVVARAAQTVPLARTEGGRVLPRAYAARRRTPPEGGATVTPPSAPAPEPAAPQPGADEDPFVEPAVATASDAVAHVPTATAHVAAAEVPSTPEPPPPRPTPRSVVVPIPAEDLRPVPPPPAGDHARAAIVTAAATVAVGLVAFVTLRGGDGRVTSESSGIAAPVPPAALESLPPLTFPLPDTGGSPQVLPADTPASPETQPRPDSTPHESSRIAAVMPSRTARATAVRTRRRQPARRPRIDSIALAREARRAADSIEREAIRRELEHRRARLDTIERSLDPAPSPPGR